MAALHENKSFFFIALLMWNALRIRVNKKNVLKISLTEKTFYRISSLYNV